MVTARRLILAGLLLPLMATVWGFFATNPYLVIAVTAVVLLVAVPLLAAGTFIGGWKALRAGEAAGTRDLVLLAIGVNVLLFLLAMTFVIFAK